VNWFRKDSAKQLYPGFEREIVKSEYQRTKLIMLVFAVGLVMAVANFFLLDKVEMEIYGGKENYFLTVWWLLGFMVYEFTVLLKLKRWKRKQAGMTKPFLLLHSLIEISFPSFLIFYNVHVMGMLVFIDSPIFLVYFVFIILAILHLDRKLTVLTAVVGALQYMAIVAYGFNWAPPSHLMPGLPENTFYLRGVLIVIAGATAGFVADELRKRIQAAFELENARTDMENLFGQQVSKEIVRTLVEDRGTARRLEATVLALDIRNFSVFAENHTPDEIIDYQNKLFGPIIDIINQHQGVVNQILGDGIMATFGTPVANPLHADMAFQSSLTIREKVRALCAAGVIPATRLGMGLHTGDIITGNIGNESRKQYSISGSAVIVAFRVEQLNKEIDSEILITEEVRKRVALGKARLQPHGLRTIKGFGTTVEVYQVL
jgi:adenylate cyclase